MLGRRPRDRRDAAARLRAREGARPSAGARPARSASSPARVALLAAFVVNERRHRNPLAPLSIFRINGLGAADATQLIAFAGFLAMFFFLTLYMQNVLGYSPIQTGARLPPARASRSGSPPASPPSCSPASAPGR